jgi:hypothetical protein
MWTQVGSCPKCGAPIYAPSVWNGITPPPVTYTCACNMGARFSTFTSTGTGCALCPGCGKAPCEGTTSACPMPPKTRITV